MFKNCLICNSRIEKTKYRSVKDFIYRTKYCSKKCSGLGIFNGNRLGSKHSIESRLKMTKTRIGKFVGENSPNWKGGLSKISENIRKCYFYKEWRESVFKRDNWTCVSCESRGYKLNADHIKPFSILIKENNIKTIDNAYECKELWDIKNGRTLCMPCHRLTDTYGGRIKSNQMLG